MITELFLNIIFEVTIFTTELIPLDLIQPQITGTLSGFIEIIERSSFFVPWKTILICLSVISSFYVFRFVVSIVNWIISKIPTIN